MKFLAVVITALLVGCSGNLRPPELNPAPITGRRTVRVIEYTDVALTFREAAWAPWFRDAYDNPSDGPVFYAVASTGEACLITSEVFASQPVPGSEISCEWRQKRPT